MAIIVFGEKSPLAAIPALGEVMGIAGHDETWHFGRNLPPFLCAFYPVAAFIFSVMTEARSCGLRRTPGKPGVFKTQLRNEM
jgi:hypothetical protein